MPQEFDLFGGGDAPLSLTDLFLSLSIGLILALVLRAHYRRYGSTLSNREELAGVLPFIVLTTVLIITVVKSSLALSLGLVGALSIVRFRTPIKEPEELAYLFIAIAIGLGLGANQIVPTVLASAFIMGAMVLVKRGTGSELGKNLYLSVQLAGNAGERQLDAINSIIGEHVTSNDLRRFDTRADMLEATYLLDVASMDNLSALVQALRDRFPAVNVTFLDQNGMPGV